MAISYSEYNKREIIYEPLLARQRFVYKGPVSSSMINLFNDQIYMDLQRLDQKSKQLQDLIDQASEISRNDMNLATPDSYASNDILMTIYSQYINFDDSQQDYSIESATPYYESALTFNKPQHNSSIISFLNAKLTLIENALKKDN